MGRLWGCWGRSAGQLKTGSSHSIRLVRQGTVRVANEHLGDNRMKRSILVYGLSVAIIGLFSSSSYALTTMQLSHMTKEQKMQAQKYFRAHSLGFSQIFKRYHPGPYWILHNAKEFGLTKNQVAQEEKLKDGMAISTITDDKKLQKAYAIYKRNAAATAPNESVLKRDIYNVGKAETLLAWEMVPYHLKGYSLLTPAQKKIYTMLAKKTWMERTKRKQ